VTNVDQWLDTRPFDRDATETPGGEGTGVNIDAIRPDIGGVDRRVAVDYELLERSAVMKKVVANP
jgi:hypothetical protein